MKEWYNRMCVYLSHMSYARVSGIKKHKSYPIEAFYYKFRSLLLDFLTEINQEFLEEKMIRLMKEIKSESQDEKTL